VIDDNAVIVVGDLGLVAELDRFAQAALGDRARIAVVQTDPPSGAVGSDAGQPLPGLGGDLAGRGQQLSQVVYGADQPAPASAGRRVALTTGGQCRGLGLGAAHSLLGVGQQAFGLAHSGFGQIGKRAGDL
jgi:hypothetical protein